MIQCLLLLSLSCVEEREIVGGSVSRFRNFSNSFLFKEVYVVLMQLKSQRNN